MDIGIKSGPFRGARVEINEAEKGSCRAVDFYLLGNLLDNLPLE